MKAKPLPILPTILLVFALPLSASAAESPFFDVTPSAWYADAVSDVSAHGWMNGIGGGRFAPDGTPTRATPIQYGAPEICYYWDQAADWREERT